MNCPTSGRLLGLDWGARRTGLALSDESQTLAQPLTTLTRRTGKRFPMTPLLELVAAHQVVGVVVGLPLDEHGAEGPAAGQARLLAGQIAKRASLPADLWDERMTTAKIRRAVHEMGGKTRGREADVDALAASLLLQHYLDARRGTGT